MDDEGRILAIGGEEFLDTSTGEVLPISQLSAAVVTGSGGFLAGTHLYRFVGPLHEMFGDFPGWTIQINAKERRLVRGSGRLAIGVFLPVYFGFIEPRTQRRSGSRKRGGRGKSERRLFHCLDLEELAGLRSVTVLDCVQHAQSILEMCKERGVRFNANKGGLSTRLLKASPRWDRSRRAAPQFVNETAREHLPGNYYGLAAPLRRVHHSAIYVDQVSAHHSVAATIPIPHPDYVRARGHYHRLDRPWIQGKDTERMDAVFSQPGLVAVMASVSHIPKKKLHLFPPFMHKPGRHVRFIYTNEREYFDGKHGTIEYVIAAWTSTVVDPVLPEYAEWSLGARHGGPGRKAILLAAYGALAQRTDRPATLYLKWRGVGMRTVLPGAGPMKEIIRERSATQPQPRHINVLARGVIEAETRKRSILLARDMEAKGIPVLSIYVDGLILDTDRLPFLPEGWEVEAHLTDVVWRHPNTWSAREMSKEPGVPRDNKPSDQARRMLAARVKPTPEGIAERAARRERDSERLGKRAQWRVRQEVLEV